MEPVPVPAPALPLRTPGSARHWWRVRFDAILLAAGRSARSTTPKPLRCVGDEPWIITVARAWRRIGASRVLAVWNPAFPPPRLARDAALEIVPNPETDLGPVRSLQAAVRHPGEPAPFAFVTPIDCPPPTPTLADLLLRSIGDRPAAHPEYLGKGGHPVLVTRGLLERISPLDPAVTRLDELLRHQGALRLAVDDPTVVLNWNDDASWQAWLALRGEDSPDDDHSWRARWAATRGNPTP